MPLFNIIYSDVDNLNAVQDSGYKVKLTPNQKSQEISVTQRNRREKIRLNQNHGEKCENLSFWLACLALENYPIVKFLVTITSQF